MTMTITDVTVLNAPGLSLEPMPPQAFLLRQTDGSSLSTRIGRSCCSVAAS